MDTSEIVMTVAPGDVVATDDAWERHRRIVDLRNLAEKTFLALGEELYYFEEEKQYRDLGYETFETYLADPSVDIERSAAFRLKTVFEKYVLRLKVAPVLLLDAGYSKLYTVANIVDETNVDEWLNKAASLSRSDLRQEIATYKRETKPPLNPYQVSANLALEMICDAIKDRDREWLLSEECSFFFDVLKVSRERIVNWAKSGCRSIEDILITSLKSEYEIPNIEYGEVSRG
jgi:hypothetical protein